MGDAILASTPLKICVNLCNLRIELVFRIKHFFELYKALEPGKWVKINGWQGIPEAHAEIMNGIERYKKTSLSR